MRTSIREVRRVCLLLVAICFSATHCFAVADETKPEKSPSKQKAAKQETPGKPEGADKRADKQPGKQKQPGTAKQAGIAKQADTAKQRVKDKSVAGKQPPTSANPKQERAALGFVEQHHKELSGLLGHLKSAEPKKYQQAIAELFRTSQRLEGFEKRDPKRFELELELWKTKSRIQVLAARMTVSTDPELEDDLLKLFKQQGELQIRQLEHEQQAVAERLTKVESQLSAKKASIDQEPQKRLEQLLQTIRRNEKQGKQTGKKGTDEKRADRKPADDKRKSDKQSSDTQEK